MPNRSSIRAALKGMLRRSSSTSSTSRVPKVHEPDSTSGRKTPEAPGFYNSDLDLETAATLTRSRSKLGIQQDIREEEEEEEEEDGQEGKHDGAPIAQEEDSQARTQAAASSCSSSGLLRENDDDGRNKHQDNDDDDNNNEQQQRTSTSTRASRYGNTLSADNPPLLIHSVTPNAANRTDSVQPASDKDSGRLCLPSQPQSTSVSRPSSPSRQRQQQQQQQQQQHHHHQQAFADHPSLASAQLDQRPETTLRRQSLITGANTPLVRALLESTTVQPDTPLSVREASDYLAAAPIPAASTIAAMMTRKIWIKRPGASPTMVTVREDDMVDDVRDLVMRKYSNSLGRSFDSPDIVLRIVSRPDNNQRPTERMLAPDEDICRTIDTYYAGGQTVDEALLIDTPARRTPRPSPRLYYQNSYAALDEFRPAEEGTDYFPPMPAVNVPAAAPPPPNNQALHPDQPRSIAVLNTGQIPVLPSPGSARRTRDTRPKFNRQHTSSPTIMTHNAPPPPMPANASNLSVSQHLPIRQGRPRVGSSASEQPHPNLAPAAPTMATPPVSDAPIPSQPVGAPPTPATSASNTLRPSRPTRQRKLTPTDGTSTNASVKPTLNGAKSSGPSSLLDGSVPPINVLIVEDNMINLKLLEAFMKRLKVRWSTAMNGQIAVNKWRAGGFHLVLMDIQLPIMSGLEATKEIRRLERVNGIGVFSNTPANGFSTKEGEDGNSEEENKKKEDDKLSLDGGSFKSPVIIVALTASSLQSDRHEALAAGCNDFLTKPVNFVWLERKVKEWGCMQALIDFDGWRKWKELANANQQETKSAADKLKEKKAKRVSRASLEAPTSKSPRPGASPEPPAAPIEGGGPGDNVNDGTTATTTTATVAT